MQIEITGHHVEITPALHAYVSEKIQRVERHFDNLIGAHVVLWVEKLEHRAEATLSVGGRTNDLFAEASAEDMYAAIDTMIDKLDRQVRRHKSKVTDHHRAQRQAQAG